MEGPRFDAMARLLARATTRRSAITAAVAAAFGGAALVTDGADARPALCRAAGRYCTHNKQCCNNRCRTGKRVPIASRNICDCDAPFAMCGKMCRDLSSDPNHCGGCGIKIDPETEICCDGVPTPIDEENCHACGEVCGSDDVCCGPEIGCAASCEPEVQNCDGSTAMLCMVTTAGEKIELTHTCFAPIPTPCSDDSECSVYVAGNNVAACVAGYWVNGASLPSVPEYNSCAAWMAEGQIC